jgi:tetratricopeptide (TPR) repeat protein
MSRASVSSSAGTHLAAARADPPGGETMLHLEDTERSTPFHSRAIDAARALAELALERAMDRDHETARNAIADALVVLDAADDPPSAAGVWIVLGEALLALYEGRRAQERFAAALVVLDPTNDVAGRARALLGIGRALHMLGDPAARTAYEQAGDLYEDIGDDAAVRWIDRELRAIEAVIEESPRSFSSSPRILIRNG